MITTLVAALVAPGGAGALDGCRAAQMTGRFALLPGSAGAGSVSYALRLRNAGSAACTISGRPGLRLLGAHGRRLPTHVVPDRRGTGTAVLVTVRPGHHAVVTARFSPDVPGPGEGDRNPCEPAARALRVTLPSPASGTLVAPVSPPTPVCEHGRLTLGLLHG